MGGGQEVEEMEEGRWETEREGEREIERGREGERERGMQGDGDRGRGNKKKTIKKTKSLAMFKAHTSITESSHYLQ